MRPTILHIDGKVGTEQGAQPAVDTVRTLGEFRRMIAFGVCALGHEQYALGTEFNAKAATFASFLDDVNDTVWYLDAISIQGLSPVCHDPTSILH